MKIGKLPRTEKQISAKYVSQLGIQSYDTDNLFPQNVLLKANASKVASGCITRYIDYLEGLGVQSDVLGSTVVNKVGETLNDIHSLVARDYAYFGGFALHCNYDALGSIVEIQSIPFENVRLTEPDENGMVSKVAVHPDWTGKTTRNGRLVSVRAEYVDYINVFNPDPAAVMMEILMAGGIENYKGQVFYYSNEGKLTYPTPTYTSVLTDMSTDEGLSNISLRNTRMNFIPAGVFAHYRDRSLISPEKDGNSRDTTEYTEDLAKLQGDVNAFKILDITVDSKEDLPTFIPFAGKNSDADYTNTSNEVKECIYSAFGQEGWLAIRNGKVGFSGTLMGDISEEYASKMVKSQKVMTDAYVRLLAKWGGEPLPAVADRVSLSIRPMVYTPSSSANTIEQKEGGVL